MLYLIFISFFGLLIHLAAGHSATHIAKDFIGGAIILIGGLTSIFCIRMGLQIRKIPSQLWQRNQQAAKLARKANRREKLNEAEKIAIHRLIKERILIATPCVLNKQCFIYLKLSDAAINNILRY